MTEGESLRFPSSIKQHVLFLRLMSKMTSAGYYKNATVIPTQAFKAVYMLKCRVSA